MSSRTVRAASAMAPTSSTHWSSDFAAFAPIVPPVVTPIWATMTSAPAEVMARASSGLKT